MKDKIEIFIADDHPVFRGGLRYIIEQDARLEIVGEAEDGLAALAGLESCAPDIAVLDIDMPGKDGFEVARAIGEKRLPVEVIFLTMHKDEHFLNASLDLGVKGYLIKDSAAIEIINCIKAVAAGQVFVSPQISGLLVKRAARRDQFAAEMPQVNSLTATERRILKFIADYKTSKEIADELCISVRTVEHHRANILEKLELKGSHSLIKFATEHKSQI